MAVALFLRIFPGDWRRLRKFPKDKAYIPTYIIQSWVRLGLEFTFWLSTWVEIICDREGILKIAHYLIVVLTNDLLSRWLHKFCFHKSWFFPPTLLLALISSKWNFVWGSKYTKNVQLTIYVIKKTKIFCEKNQYQVDKFMICKTRFVRPSDEQIINVFDKEFWNEKISKLT